MPEPIVLVHGGAGAWDEAAVMTGDLRFGAVGACPPVASAVALALAILEDGEHSLLVGEGAVRFAEEHGIEVLGSDDLTLDRARLIFEREGERRAAGRVAEGGTVGAVALDSEGRLAAATSTGGIPHKRAGRVGDTPLPGAGTYADEETGGAASATGEGESILRVLLCREAVGQIGDGMGVDEAGTAALRVLKRRAGGRAGLVLLARDGSTFAGKNTPFMPWASCRPGEAPLSGS